MLLACSLVPSPRLFAAPLALPRSAFGSPFRQLALASHSGLQSIQTQAEIPRLQGIAPLRRVNLQRRMLVCGRLGRITSPMTAPDRIASLSRSPKPGTILLIPAFSVGLSAPAAPASGSNCPQFRGPNARGLSTTEKPPEHGSATEHVVWQAEISGRGWSSPIILG